MRALMLGCVVALAAGLALAARGGTSGPTYYKDVAPILDAKCTTCHHLGGIAPFALTTAVSAKAHAAGIAQMTKTGLMPPWMPGPDSASIIGRDQRRLTPAELSTLAAWVASGAPLGDPSDLHAKPLLGAGLTGPGTTISVAPPKAYTPHGAGGAIDDYHCFVLNPHLTHDVFVTGALIKPQRTGIVHHVILYEASGPLAAAADQMNAAHGGNGWTCFGGPGLPLDLASADSLDRLGQPPWIAAWVPGHTTNALPKGTGVLLHAGARIVMQVHYNLIEAAGPDRSQAWLRIRPVSAGVTRLQTKLIAAPVELPCPDGVGGSECTRRQAFQDEVAKYGVQNAYIPTALLALCGKTLADYPQEVGNGKSIATSCDRAITQKETIYGVAGHMHLRGRDISITIDPGTPKQQTLLHIPAWDFHWQDVYYLVHPVAVGPGDTIRVSCTFDNSKADQPVIGTKQLAPRYVLWGEGTTDEMCLGMLDVAAG